MEEVKKIVEKLTVRRNPAHAKELYKQFAMCKCNEAEDFGSLFPRISTMFDEGLVQKDIFYLSLLAHGNVEMLQKCQKFYKDKFSLNIIDPATLYDNCVYNNPHWFYEVLNNYHSLLKIFDKDIANRILLIKIVQISHGSDVGDLPAVLSKINVEDLDEFWKHYVDEVEKLLQVYNHCKKLSPEFTAKSHNAMAFASRHSVLEAFSNYLELQDVSYNEITSKLSEVDEIETFTSFTILSNVLKAVTPGENDPSQDNHFLGNLTTTSKNYLVERIQNPILQIETLENLYGLLFLRNEYNFLETSKYICKQKEVRLILYLVKTLLDEVVVKRRYTDRDAMEQKRLNNLIKYTTDALWRLDLITNVKSHAKLDRNFLGYMCAPPESLIHMCFKTLDFERAHQVIKIFNMESHSIAIETAFAHRLLTFRRQLKEQFTGAANLSEDDQKNFECEIKNEIENFFQTNPTPESEEDDDLIDCVSCEYNFLNHFRSSSDLFIRKLDLALTLPQTIEQTEALLELSLVNNSLSQEFTSDFSEFSKRILFIYNSGTKRAKSLPDLLTSHTGSFNPAEMDKEATMWRDVAACYDQFLNKCSSVQPGSLNMYHEAHEVYWKLHELCKLFSKFSKGSIWYLTRLFNYLRAFSKVLYIEQDSSHVIAEHNCSLFKLLKFNRSELMGKLLFELELDPKEFEKYFGRLKLDFLYHVVGNCFPTINLHLQEKVSEEELYPYNNLYIPSKNNIIYIQNRNWLLAFLLTKLYKLEEQVSDIQIVEDEDHEIRGSRVCFFTNYINLDAIQRLKVLFNNNPVITALQNEFNYQKVEEYAKNKIRELECKSHIEMQLFEHNTEIGFEVNEDCTKEQWKELLFLLDSLPEQQSQKFAGLAELRDNIFVNLVNDSVEEANYMYVSWISNPVERGKVILKNMVYWPANFCCHVINCEITRNVPVTNAGYINELRNWLKDIIISEELRLITAEPNWYKQYGQCQRKPLECVQTLHQQGSVQVLLNFIEMYKIKPEDLSMLDEEYFLRIFKANAPLDCVKSLFGALRFEQAINICYKLLEPVKRLCQLEFIVNYLLNNVNDPMLKYLEIGIKMILTFPEAQHGDFVDLAYDPLLIIEVLLMNYQLEKLAGVLGVLKKELQHSNYQLNISVEQIDVLLRQYAEKGLDFRVITQPNVRLLKTPECKLMESMDNLMNEQMFVMPEEVPTREQWVPNEDVLTCMCCNHTVFSMFKRRHHCRRCGRVICHGCSPKMAMFEPYEIFVRVCIDCYEQIVEEYSHDFSDSSDAPEPADVYYVLTKNDALNEIVRQEFSYHHGPCVSICTSIMKLHSKTSESSKFMLKQCETMLTFLHPSQELVQEIDNILVLKMIRTLAGAAKIASDECSYPHGLVVADKVLEQVDLLTLLAERGCLHLLPISRTPDPYIEQSALITLVNKLLEREQWNLGLEVSTKAGLDINGVFAVRGKISLKAGSLLQAREIFQRILTVSHLEILPEPLGDLDESSDSLLQPPPSGTRSRRSSRLSNLSSISESKPIKNPAILDEIIAILESKTIPIDPTVLQNAKEPYMAPGTSGVNLSVGSNIQAVAPMTILNKLHNLKNIVAGNLQPLGKLPRMKYSYKPTVANVFYEECIYYLQRYGSHLGLLEFYIQHGEMDKALNYILDNNLSSEYFIDIYMRCLKDGIINVLQSRMVHIDSTLKSWKVHLSQIGGHMVKQNLFHSLYQLQQFIGDYVRAAVSCIKFYEEDVTTFSDFTSKTRFLYNAERHCNQALEQEQWVDVASEMSSVSVSQENLAEQDSSQPPLILKLNAGAINKQLNTISMQIEVAQYLSDCEKSGAKPSEVVANIFASDPPSKKKMPLPTLFNSPKQKMQLAVLAIICGEELDIGFHIAMRISREFNLKSFQIYCEAGKYMAKAGDYQSITQLVSCIKKSGINDNTITDICDRILFQAVTTFTKANVAGTKVEELIKLITDRPSKISAYIEAKQLKTAYFLAVKYKRMSDIRRILREAELLNQPQIKSLCVKVLQNHNAGASQGASHSKDQ